MCEFFLIDRRNIVKNTMNDNDQIPRLLWNLMLNTPGFYSLSGKTSYR